MSSIQLRDSIFPMEFLNAEKVKEKKTSSAVNIFIIVTALLKLIALNVP